MQYSVAIRNARAQSDEDVIGTEPIARIIDGDMPANCAAADAGTVLAEITAPSDWQSDPSGGAVGILGTWQDPSADASGKARYFRIYESTGTTCHAQCLVSEAWAEDSVYALNDQVNNGANVYICVTAGTSDSSGGPTGTGSGITDNTAEWDYVGPVGMVVADVNIGATEPFNITSLNRTMGNA